MVDCGFEERQSQLYLLYNICSAQHARAQNIATFGISQAHVIKRLANKEVKHSLIRGGMAYDQSLSAHNSRDGGCCGSL
jgi:hypothetical protein